jgi:radical SAM protein with 4Fe4S-binding SPASM domain
MQNLRELFVEITNKCFLNCKHCSTEASFLCSSFISSQRMFSLIDEGLELGITNLALSGGEPLIHPEWPSIIAYAKNKGLKVCVYSCGVFLNESDSLTSLPDEIISKLKELNVDNIIFSVHGFLSETHDDITGINGSFQCVINSITSCIEKGITPEVHFVPMKQNYHEIKDIVGFLRDLGIKKISLLRLVRQGRARQNENDLALKATEGLEIANMIKKLRLKYNDIQIRLGAPFNCVNPSNPIPCSAAQSKLLISPNGEVFPCEAFKFLRGRMLNINECSLKYVWEHDMLLNQLRNPNYQDIEGCKGCHMVDQCKAGCPGERMLFNDGIEKGPEIWCLRI